LDTQIPYAEASLGMLPGHKPLRVFVQRLSTSKDQSFIPLPYKMRLTFTTERVVVVPCEDCKLRFFPCIVLQD